MLIDVEIAGGFKGEIEASVLGEQLQHVIEKADAGGDFVRAAAFDAQAAPICVSLVLRSSFDCLMPFSTQPPRFG